MGPSFVIPDSEGGKSLAELLRDCLKCLYSILAYSTNLTATEVLYRESQRYQRKHVLLLLFDILLYVSLPCRNKEIILDCQLLAIQLLMLAPPIISDIENVIKDIITNESSTNEITQSNIIEKIAKSLVHLLHVQLIKNGNCAVSSNGGIIGSDRIASSLVPCLVSYTNFYN
jgi:hypothetical protein